MITWEQEEPRNSHFIDEIYAEDFRFFPQVAAPNCRATADPARQIRMVKICFDDQAREAGGMAHAAVSTSLPYVDVDLKQFPEKIMQNDKLQRMRTNMVYQVLDVQPDGQSRAHVTLTEIGRGA